MAYGAYKHGAIPLDTGQVLAALLGDTPRNITLVVTEQWLPRVLMALLIDAMLGESYTLAAVLHELNQACRYTTHLIAL